VLGQLLELVQQLRQGSGGVYEARQRQRFGEEGLEELVQQLLARSRNCVLIEMSIRVPSEVETSIKVMYATC
jgi:hypothetical protein